MTAHRVLSRKCALACLPSGKYRSAHRQCLDVKCGCFCHLSSATASSAVQAVGNVIGADGSSPTATDLSSRSPVGP